ncbi:cupin domain-containing protein [Janthinobacterium agaricidamnosum]|uniref:Cupin domain protein n=1 Tax=Janthinobacterium agaricidamnosum NBRC 102515 = DSM 9628 TaxID=1349767 RepID=W0V119_9BURK|nr:cupin domain-containing protein [Janthinobacterium agaricidamnosum]CDG81566.1 cupin domain protein [Janthinobacterium agaricidamnosum NBRC 102515 = DSM 9628]
MKTMRLAALAALVFGSVLAHAETQNVMTGLTRTQLLRHDVSVAGREVIQVRVDFERGTFADFHSHPGEEIAFVVEGTMEYQFQGQPAVILNKGDSLFIPAGTNHSAKNIGEGKASELATYFVDKSKPLVVPAH